jgi:hypothetical protein
MGRGAGEGLSLAHLEQERVTTLRRGDAVFFDRWTIHATAPNESREKRRGWALHYADARSTWGDHGVAGRDGEGIVDHDDPVARARCRARNLERVAPPPERPVAADRKSGISEGGSHTQWGAYNLIGGKLNGNREDVLVCGRSHPGCI